MRSYAPLFLSLLPFTLSQAPPAANGPLIPVLRATGHNVYADYLEMRAPLTLARCRNRTDLVIFAPRNTAPIPVGPASNITLRRRNQDEEAQVQQQINDDRSPPPWPPVSADAPAGDAPEAERRRWLQKRQSAPFPDSNFEVRRTFLVDPNYVNLGPNEYYSVVSNYAYPAGWSGGGADLEIRTGLGNIVIADGDPIKFDNGVIYPIDKWFTLPQPLSHTLPVTDGAQFAESITAAGLTVKLDETPRITVFCPLNGLPAGQSPETHIAYNTLVYSPGFVPDTMYGGVKVTKDGESWYANGGKIVKSDIPIKNGVVHYYENTNGVAPADGVPGVTMYTGDAATMRGSIVGAMVAVGAAVWGLV